MTKKTYNSLSLAQRIKIIDAYIKETFTKVGDSTYLMPRMTLAQMAKAATDKLGYKVTPQNVASCIETMEELELKVERPAPAAEGDRARISELEKRVATLESHLEGLSQEVHSRRFQLMNVRDEEAAKELGLFPNGGV